MGVALEAERGWRIWPMLSPAAGWAAAGCRHPSRHAKRSADRSIQRWRLPPVDPRLPFWRPVVRWWITSAGSKPVVTSPQQSTNGDVVAPAGPNFCGVQLSGSSVVYLLDRGDSAKEVFDAMKEATYKSIESLGPDRKFQVLLWDNNTGDAGFPNTSTTFATKENLEACRKQLEDITAQHQSTVHGPLARAVSENPDSIVVMTAKGFELDDAFQSDVESVVKGSPVKLYTISIQNESQADCKPLQTLAKESGGTYKSLSAGAMQAAIGD
jgi:hypothetical protein